MPLGLGEEETELSSQVEGFQTAFVSGIPSPPMAWLGQCKMVQSHS